MEVEGCSPVIEQVLSRCEVLGSIPSIHPQPTTEVPHRKKLFLILWMENGSLKVKQLEIP